MGIRGERRLSAPGLLDRGASRVDPRAGRRRGDLRGVRGRSAVCNAPGGRGGAGGAGAAKEVGGSPHTAGASRRRSTARTMQSIKNAGATAGLRRDPAPPEAPRLAGAGKLEMRRRYTGAARGPRATHMATARQKQTRQSTHTTSEEGQTGTAAETVTQSLSTPDLPRRQGGGQGGGGQGGADAREQPTEFQRERDTT